MIWLTTVSGIDFPAKLIVQRSCTKCVDLGSNFISGNHDAGHDIREDCGCHYLYGCHSL